MNYKVRIVLKEVYEVWVEADDDETAEILAVKKMHSGDDSVSIVHDSVDTIIDEVEE